MSDSDLHFIGGPDPERRPEKDGDLAALDYQYRIQRELRRQRWIMRVILAIVAGAVLYLLAGCGITPIGQRAQDAIATGVAIYCIKPETERAIVREIVAAKIRPNRIVVECAND